MILPLKSSLWETGVGNLPAIKNIRRDIKGEVDTHTLGETGTKETGNLLDQGVGSDEGIVLACELLDQLLVLVELLQIVGRHGINTAVLGTIDIMLVTKNAAQISAPPPQSSVLVDVPDGHVWSGDNRKAYGS